MAPASVRGVPRTDRSPRGRCGLAVQNQAPPSYVALTPNPVIEIIPSITPPPASQPLSHYAEVLSSLREVANAHVLLAMALLGIVLLQCGKFYSERLQERERNEEVDARILRRLRQLQQEERSKSNTDPPAMAPSPGGPDAST